MLKKTVTFVSFFTVILLLAGCGRILPVKNFYDQPVPMNLSSKQVKTAIENAANSHHWAATAVKPGLINAHVFVRGHKASVKIPYSAKSYSIIYKSSENMSYANGKIHRNYNKWVILLNRSIQHQLH